MERFIFFNYKTKGEMSKALTGIKDVDILTLSYLNDRDLFNFCRNESKNKYVNTICSDENFWYKRFMNKYGRMKVGNEIKENSVFKDIKDPSRTWKNFYLKATYYIDKFEKKEFSKEEVSKENQDLISFLQYYLGYISLKNTLPLLDRDDFKTMQIYTDTDKHFPDLPDFPYGVDIITISKIGENYYLFSENNWVSSDGDDEFEIEEGERVTKNQINLFLEKLMYFYLIKFINLDEYESVYNYRNYLPDLEKYKN